MRFGVGIAVLATALGGCQFVPGTDASKIKSAETTVVHDLKDASSAQFRNERVVGKYVCGEVNGKNAFGALGGFQEFAVERGTSKEFFYPSTITSTDDKESAALFPSACHTPSAEENAYNRRIIQEADRLDFLQGNETERPAGSTH